MKPTLTKHIMRLGTMAVLSLAALTSCDTDPEALQLQTLNQYSDEYYAALRDYKATYHELCYVYYADWAPIEGATGYKDPASWGERIVGLPDSIDIVNLWMGIPTPETHPVAYQDMIETRDKKGTRFVYHADASNYNHQFTLTVRDDGYNATGERKYYDLLTDRSEEAIRAYARWVCDTVVKTGLDGVDFDYEGWTAQQILWVAEECNKLFGPNGMFPDMLVIIDYFNSSPPTSCDPYVDYYVKQAYSQQGAGVGASGHPDEKVIYCESFGQQPTGGKILEYAAWEPDGGHKGGCGAYYVERNYYNTSDGVPYGAIRQAIQIMNPAKP